MRRRLLHLLLVVLGLPAYPQEVSPAFSGRVSAEAGDQPGSLNAVSDVGFEARWEGLSGQVVGGAGLREGRATWDLPLAWVAFTTELGEIKAGVWPDSRGPAQFRSLVPGFTTGSGTEFLATAGTVAPPSPGKVALKLVAGEWSWTGEVSPWRPAAAVPDTTSPWFPRKDLPTSLGEAPFSWSLATVRTAEVPPQSTQWWQWPLDSNLRWSAVWGDAVAGIYRGEDPQALILPSILISTSTTFDLVLRPRPQTTSIGWFTLEIPLGGGKIWTEQRWVDSRLGSVSGSPLLVGETLELRTSTSSVWEGLWGGAYSLSAGSWGQVRVWSEASVYRDLGAPEKKAPDFTASWVGGVTWEDSRGFGRLDVLAGTPWDPAQGWLWGRATWNWMEGRTLWLGAPVFWGAADTAWGQFASRRVWALGTTWDQ